jgi:hypothetical protein
MRLLTVDPGKHAVGWAAFDGGELQRCGYLKVEDLGFLGKRGAELLICEIPQIYQGRRQEGDPNDLIPVAIVVGRVIEAVHSQRICHVEIQAIKPSHWKGNRSKEIDQPYTLSLLSPAETSILDGCGVAKSTRHNVIDAIGIGLWHLNRRKR